MDHTDEENVEYIVANEGERQPTRLQHQCSSGWAILRATCEYVQRAFDWIDRDSRPAFQKDKEDQFFSIYHG